MSVSLKHECPWCDRIFTLDRGHWMWLNSGEKVLICETCYMNYLDTGERNG